MQPVKFEARDPSQGAVLPPCPSPGPCTTEEFLSNSVRVATRQRPLHTQSVAISTRQWWQRAFLREAGLDPELIRISVGAEPYGEIEAVFAEALDYSLL